MISPRFEGAHRAHWKANKFIIYDFRESDVWASVVVVHRAVSLSTQPLHQESPAEKDSYLHVSTTGGSGHSLRVRLHTLALHQDDIPDSVGVFLTHQVRRDYISRTCPKKQVSRIISLKPFLAGTNCSRNSLNKNIWMQLTRQLKTEITVYKTLST